MPKKTLRTLWHILILFKRLQTLLKRELLTLIHNPQTGMRSRMFHYQNCTCVHFDINDRQSTKSCQRDAQSRDCGGGLMLYGCQEQASGTPLLASVCCQLLLTCLPNASSPPELFKQLRPPKLLRSEVTYVRWWPVCCTSRTEESVSFWEKTWEKVWRQGCSTVPFQDRPVRQLQHRPQPVPPSPRAHPTNRWLVMIDAKNTKNCVSVQHLSLWLHVVLCRDTFQKSFV